MRIVHTPHPTLSRTAAVTGTLHSLSSLYLTVNVRDCLWGEVSIDQLPAAGTCRGMHWASHVILRAHAVHHLVPLVLVQVTTSTGDECNPCV
jgi:hypothetical protein